MSRTVTTLFAASGLPLLEARALLAHRLGVTRERLVAHPELAVDAADADAFIDLARRRAGGEPLAYLLGDKEFYGRSFAVSPAVLVPRPETELLVDLALERMRALEEPRALDLGTGSGCIAITLALECRRARVVASDVSPAALQVARGNAATLGAEVVFHLGDWYGAVPADRRFDVIVANPPYVAPGDPHLDALRFEPLHALTDGRNGLACLEAIVAGAPAYLATAGWLLVEHGHDQAPAVRSLFAARGLRARTVADAAGHPRVTLGQPG